MVNKKVIDREKQLILQEEVLKKSMINEIINQSKPKKNVKTKEVIKLPMPTSEQVIQNKSINLKTYGAIMLHSRWGGQLLNQEDRYVYNEYLDKKCEEISLECNISKRTLKRHITALKKCNVKIFEPVAVNGELVYKLNYSIEGQEFITVDSVALRKLCNAYSENTLKLYLIFSYTCIEAKKGRGRSGYKVSRVEKLIKQDWLCKKLGISYNSRVVITDCVEALQKGGFINVREDYKLSPCTDADNKVVSIHKKPEFYYSLSDDYLNNK